MKDGKKQIADSSSEKNRHKETVLYMLGCHVCNQVAIIITGISDIIVIHKQFCSRHVQTNIH